MEKELTEIEKAAGAEFVELAIGMSGDVLEKKISDLRNDALSSLMRFLLWSYDGALTGFAASLHAFCVLEASERFVRHYAGSEG